MKSQNLVFCIVLMLVAGCANHPPAQTPVVNIGGSEPYYGPMPKWEEPLPKVTKQDVKEIRELTLSVMDYVQRNWKCTPP